MRRDNYLTIIFVRLKSRIYNDNRSTFKYTNWISNNNGNLLNRLTTFVSINITRTLYFIDIEFFIEYLTFLQFIQKLKSASNMRAVMKCILLAKCVFCWNFIHTTHSLRTNCRGQTCCSQYSIMIWFGLWIKQTGQIFQFICLWFTLPMFTNQYEHWTAKEGQLLGFLLALELKYFALN